jgi:hypothetical protein
LSVVRCEQRIDHVAEWRGSGIRRHGDAAMKDERKKSEVRDQRSEIRQAVVFLLYALCPTCPP